MSLEQVPGQASEGAASRAPLSEVKVLADPQDAQRWDEFVRRMDEGSFFHLSGWRRVMEEYFRKRVYYLFVEREGNIEGVLPLVRNKSWLFGDALISTPFLVYGGDVASSEEASKALIEKAVDIAETLEVDYLELRNQEETLDWPTSTNYVTFRKAIEDNPESNLMAIPRKQRAMIRKGEKFGLKASKDDEPDRLFSSLSECKRNLGTPFFAFSYFEYLKTIFGPECEILTVTRQGETICSVMSFVFRREILPYYGGGGLAARKYAANDFMYWKVMEDACNRGVETFDFGRSRKGTGAYSFKKNWGFEPQPLYHHYYLVKASQIPNLSPSNERYAKLIDSWRRLPLWVTKTIGPSLAKRIG